MESYISRTSGIKARDKIGYAFGDLASCLVFGLTQSVLNKYYTDVLEISVLNVMIMTIIARIWDAVNDPIWGRWPRCSCSWTCGASTWAAASPGST